MNRVRSISSPSEFPLQPRQPIAVTGDGFAFRQPLADFDDIGDDAPAEPTYLGGVLGEAVAKLVTDEREQVGERMKRIACFRSPVMASPRRP